jgi:MipA family protein
MRASYFTWHSSFLAAAAAATLLLPAGAQAQPGPLPLWEVGVLGVLASTPAYPASSDRTSRALVLPAIIYRGEVLRSDRSGVGARVIKADNYEFDVGFSAALPANSNDVAARQGMPDLGTLIEFGPRLKVTLAQAAPGSRLRLELPLRAVLEFNGGVREQGVVFEPALVYEQRDVGGGWSMSTSAGLIYGNQRINQYFYGVDAAYATATRAQYDAQSGLIGARLGLSTTKSLSPDWRVAGFVRFENYAVGANRASPLHLASGGTSVGVAFIWTLARSGERAKD